MTLSYIIYSIISSYIISYNNIITNNSNNQIHTISLYHPNMNPFISYQWLDFGQLCHDHKNPAWLYDHNLLMGSHAKVNKRTRPCCTVTIRNTGQTWSAFYMYGYPGWMINPFTWDMFWTKHIGYLWSCYFDTIERKEQLDRTTNTGSERWAVQ